MKHFHPFTFFFLLLTYFSGAQKKDTVAFDHIFGQGRVKPVDEIMASENDPRLNGYWKFKKLFCVDEGNRHFKTDVKDTSFHIIAFFPDHTAMFNTNDKIFWTISSGGDSIVLFQQWNEKLAEHYYSLRISRLRRRRLTLLLPRSQFKDASGKVCDCKNSIIVLRKTKKIRAIF
ncbi:MAG TPA: hypothetical protein VI112_17755 [Bacteroidia bacterium]